MRSEYNSISVLVNIVACPNQVKMLHSKIMEGEAKSLALSPEDLVFQCFLCRIVGLPGEAEWSEPRCL